MIRQIENNQDIIPKEYNILILLGGSITILLNGQHISIPSKCYFFFDEPFQIVASSPYLEGFVFELDSEFVNAFPQVCQAFSELESGFRIEKIRSFENKKSLIDALLKVQDNRKLSQSYVHVLVSEFLIDAKLEVEQTIVQKFSELIDQNLEYNYCAGTYANMMDIPLKKLIKEVKKEVNKTPCSIITERVILKAKHLLKNTNETSQTIAYRLGFEDPYYFIKYFKKNTGHTPTQFRTRQELVQ